MHLLLFFPATIALLGLLHVANCEQAMTTVLARPLGGYGLTPLIFEPSPSLASSSYSSLGALLGLGSSQLETKVRKSPVYELIMPNYDDEALSTGFTMEAPPPPPAQPLPLKSSARKAPSKGSASSAKKSVDYESLISKQSAADRAALVSALPSTSSYYSTASGMLGSNVLFGSSQHSVGKSSHSSHSSYYNEPMPSYKESISRSDNFGGGGGGSKGGGYSGGQSSYGDGGGSLGGGLNAAIQSVRSVEVKDVQNMYENAEPQVIDIPPSGLPIVINFRTSSSQIQIHQTHENAEPVVVEPTKSEDEPTYLKHQVTKPVIQEVHEIIMPYRKILQEIQPVQEEVKTIVARGKPRDQGKRGGGGGKYNSNANAGYGGGHKSRGGGLGGLGGDINMSTGKSYKS